jgi:hypothetical protein
MSERAVSHSNSQRKIQMANPEKTRENRLRRIAARDGFRLVKSRVRNSAMPEHGGYMVINNATNGCVHMVINNATNGCVHGLGETFQYTADLDSVEWFFDFGRCSKLARRLPKSEKDEAEDIPF